MPTKVFVQMVLLLLLSIGFRLCAQNSNSGKSLTNRDVVNMVGSGLSTLIIKAAIEKSKSSFDLSPSAMIGLKRSAVPDDVILAMISKERTEAASAPEDSIKGLSSGLYYGSIRGYTPVAGHKLIQLNSKGALGMLKKTIGNLVNLNLRASIQNEHSETRITSQQPTFIFVLDYPAKGPQEFFLVRLTSLKYEREIQFQKTSALPGIIGLSDTLKINFDSRKISEGIFEVKSMHFLKAGEYCFLYNASALYRGKEYAIFDFSITDQTTSKQ